MSPQELDLEWHRVALQDNVKHPPFAGVERAQLDATRLPDEAKDFLENGLPEKTFLYTLDLIPPLNRVYEVFARNEWNDSTKVAVEPYFVLGADGGGNAICIHEVDGDIWLLDHEDFFQSREFINSSLKQFLEFLLLLLKGWVGELRFADLLEPMKAIDSKAMQPEHTWLQVLLEEIEEEKE
ncbi:hypothetical protein EON80_15955 [bacterium]|nr:MAG: hypothetical protein EON80_15955 [bacterium]